MIQAPPRTLMEVFESLPEGTLCQLINNQLIMSPSPSSQHQRIVRNIFRQLDNYVEENKIGEVFSPVDVFLDTENAFQPDILFISNERIHIVQDKIKGPPDLIIQVLSPGTEKFDKKDKKEVYQRVGVKEYWIVHPISKKVSGFQLIDGIYVDIPSGSGEIASAMFNLIITF